MNADHRAHDVRMTFWGLSFGRLITLFMISFALTAAGLVSIGPVDNHASPMSAYSPQHVYAFSIIAPGGPLRFAVNDIQFSNNPGNYVVTLTPQLAAMRFTDPPTLDGDLDEWPTSYMQVLDATTANYTQGQIPSSSDASTTIRAAWDDNYLYFALQVTDDVFIADSAEVWRDDGVQVALDGANDDTGNNADDHDFVAAADGRLLDFGITALDGALVSVKPFGDGGYMVEMAVHKSLVGGSLTIGRLIGFNLGLADDDDGGSTDSWLLWAGQYANQGQQDFTDLRLLAEAFTPASPPPSYWTQHTSNTTTLLRGLHMRSAAEGLAVGAGGKVLRYDSSWQNVSVPEPRDPHAVFMSGSNSGWVSGAGGVIWRNNSGTWTQTSSPTGEILWDIDMLSASDAWIIGTAGKILHYDGTSWDIFPSPSQIFSGLGLDMISATNGWIVGDRGLIWHFNGTSWSTVASSTVNDLYDVAMVSESEGWAVGQNGTILRYKNGIWHPWGSPTSTVLLGVKMAGAEDGWAVGEDGTIIRYNGRGWSKVASPTTRDLEDVSVLNASNAWAVGHNGTILQFHPPAAPTETPTPKPPTPTATPRPPTPTATPRPHTPTATPRPHTPTATPRPPTPTATPSQIASRRLYIPFSRRAATATPSPTPTPTPLPVIDNGGFESGFAAWSTGGSFAPPQIRSNIVHSGTRAAVLGNPDEPCTESTDPRNGDSWVTQYVLVPNTGTPELVVWYRIFTWDRNGGLNDELDRFEVWIDDQRVLRDANQTPIYGCGRPPTDLGWKRFNFDLSAYRGQWIALKLTNIVWPDKAYNTWTYVDDIVVR